MMLLTKVQVTDVWECKWEAKKSYGEFEVAKFKFSPPPVDDTTHVRGHGECQDFDRHILPARVRANKISVLFSRKSVEMMAASPQSGLSCIAAMHLLSINIYSTSLRPIFFLGVA